MKNAALIRAKTIRNEERQIFKTQTHLTIFKNGKGRKRMQTDF